jgi:hypothetical protein
MKQEAQTYVKFDTPTIRKTTGLGFFQRPCRFFGCHDPSPSIVVVIVTHDVNVFVENFTHS